MVFNRRAGEQACPTTLVRISPDGTPSIAADGLWFPNGMVITPEGDMLVVAETFAHRLTTFDIGVDGSCLIVESFSRILICIQMAFVWIWKAQFG
ncbi:MAG: hypothetical protein CM1200mP4_4880 [Rhodospirillaceae bacterium]|nr:MAG: hypothetical protein CM1200mP4_4880 [Rhodospirillaceae bacterium]